MENLNPKRVQKKTPLMALVAEEIKKNFSLDPRSLTLFRVGVGIILLVDFLCTRLPWFTLFYSEKGLLPFKSFLGDGSFQSVASSLNFVTPLLGYQIALFILAIIFFLMLLVGYKTKWALLGSWVLLVSFHSRNFLILNSGDVLLCLLLFWALRLPLGKYFSIEGALRNQKEKPVFSINSIAFIFQILLVYFFAYILKTDEIWKTNQGVYYALQLENFRTIWGDILLQYPGLMRVLSFITYYVIEVQAGFVFIFFGFLWRVKTALIFCMCLFHLSLGVFLHLGLFPWICMVGWLALLPSEFWEKIKYYFSKRKKTLKAYYDGDCSFCKKTIFLIHTFLILQKVLVFTIQSDKEAKKESEKTNSWVVFDPETGWHGRWQAFSILVSRSPLFFYLAPLLRSKWVSFAGDRFYGTTAKHRRRLGYLLPKLREEEKQFKKMGLSILLSVFFFFSFFYILAWNVRTVNFQYYSQYMSTKWNGFGAFFHLYQYWNMFAPKPMDTTGWIILSAVRKDTEEKIDLWREGKPLSMKKPKRYDTRFPIFRFRKMLENLVYEHKKYSKNYLLYLCHKWNKNHPDKAVKSIKLIYMKQKVPPPGEDFLPPKKISIRKRRCPRRLLSH